MFRTFLTCLLVPAAVMAADPREEIATKVPAARAILDGWQSAHPERGRRVLHVVLWTPADREPAPRYRERLSAALLDIREFYAREMERIGFGRRTLEFDCEDQGSIRIHRVKGAKPYASYKTESGHEIRNECLAPLRAAGIEPDKETVVIFCNMSNWDPEKRTITQNSPYYAGGTHRNGTAWQVDSPILDVDHLPKHEPKVRDGQYGHISIGRYNSIFIGGICHELGHALGLPHNCERADEREAFGTALMGSGNRTYGEERRGEGKGSFLTLASALRLASHPIFCGSVKGIDVQAGAVPSELAITSKGRGFVFSGRVTADPPVYGVIAYMDPDGGGDYDATTATAVPDKDGRFELDCQALAPGKTAELRIVYLQANGVASGFLSATPYRYAYQVDGTGQADIAVARSRLVLKPLVDAVNAGNSTQVREFLATPMVSGDAGLARIARRFAATLEPADRKEITGGAAEVPLSDLPAQREITGYGRPVRDRLPTPGGLLEAGGRVFAHGFYAHAPATHVWKLDGHWKQLRGTAGIAAGFDGSVKFAIEGDGRALWQSGDVKAGRLLPFEVDLAGVKELTLRTTDGGNGNREDWALWLEPVLVQ